MNNRFFLIIVLFFLFSTTQAISEEKSTYDIVYLKNGKEIKGEILNKSFWKNGKLKDIVILDENGKKHSYIGFNVNKFEENVSDKDTETSQDINTTTNNIDIVYLKNGSILKGIIIEQKIGESIKLQMNDGSISVFNISEIEKIEKTNKTSINNNNIPENVQDLLKVEYIGFWKKPHFFYKGKKYPLKNQNVKKYSKIISVYPEALNEFNSYKSLHKSATNCNTAATIFTIASCVYMLTHREKLEVEPITLPNYSKILSLNQVNKSSSATGWHSDWNVQKKKEDWTDEILFGVGGAFCIVGCVYEKHARSHLDKSAEIYNRNLKQNLFNFFYNPSNRLSIAVGKSDLFVRFTFSF